MQLQPGNHAPDFTVFSDAKEAFTLSDQRGRMVLLLFFPGAFTSVCTTELNTVNKEREDFGAETLVVGVSTDSPPVLAEFKKVNGFSFPLLSDHNAAVSAQYGAKYDHDFTPMALDRIAKRSAFVIDEAGIVRNAEVLENAGRMPDFEAIKSVLTSTS